MDIEEFISKSNAIENVHSDKALETSLFAWDYLQKQDELTEEVVKTTHEKIMEELQPDIAGEYRNVMVHVGNDIPPEPASIRPKMEELVSWEPQTAFEALEWHIQFEKVHPFRDGNGRTGRLLYAWVSEEFTHSDPLTFGPEHVQGYYDLISSYD